MSKILVVVDMQNDFVTDALKNEEAEKIVGPMRERLEEEIKAGTKVFFTRDTHFENYLETQEGRLLPVEHCIKDSRGWQIVDSLKPFATEDNTLDKPSFGSLQLPQWISEKLGGKTEDIDEIQFWGVCTDICVISNAMIMKAAFPEIPVSVVKDLCAGVTPESHENAINAMAACQIAVK